MSSPWTLTEPSPMNRIFSKNFLDEVNVVVSFLIWHLDWRTNRCVTNDDDHHLDFYRWPWIKKKMMGLRWVAASTCHSTSFFSWLDRFYFFLPTPNRPSRVNRIESVKETDVFSSKRLRKGEKRRCDSSFVTESIERPSSLLLLPGLVPTYGNGIVSTP